jgi:choloylglycine hydrolase
MRQKLLSLLIVILTLLVLWWPQPVAGCSTFVIGKAKFTLFGRNYDFFTGTGFILTNPRGLVKTALVMPGHEPASWIAKYGSITFNQVGREFPMDGMNEAGLVVACMWLPGTVYPAPDSRKCVMELQWMQYLLDTCATIEEAVATDKKIRIAHSNQTIHFLVAEKNGQAAVVEFINGESKIYWGKTLPFRVLTNSTYEESLTFSRGFRGLGGKKAVPNSPNSLDRFTRLALKTKQMQTRAHVKGAFKLLANVEYHGKKNDTHWQAVYDPNRLTITFKTHNDNKVSQIKLKDFSLDCQSIPMVLDLDKKRAKDIAKSFTTYTPALNRTFVKRTFAIYHKNDFVKDIPEMYLNILANYPGSLKCQ